MRGYRLGLQDDWLITRNHWEFNKHTGGVYPSHRKYTRYNETLTPEEVTQALIREGVNHGEILQLYWSRSFIVPMFPSDGLLLSEVADQHAIHRPGDGALFYNAILGYTAWWRRTSKKLSAGVDGIYQCVWSSADKVLAGQNVEIARGMFRVIPYHSDTLEVLFL